MIVCSQDWKLGYSQHTEYSWGFSGIQIVVLFKIGRFWKWIREQGLYPGLYKLEISMHKHRLRICLTLESLVGIKGFTQLAEHPVIRIWQHQLIRPSQMEQVHRSFKRYTHKPLQCIKYHMSTSNTSICSCVERDLDQVLLLLHPLQFGLHSVL